LDVYCILNFVAGCPASKTELDQILDSVQGGDGFPVLIGSGIDPENVQNFARANAFIVGSYFKKSGKWQNSIDEHRVEKLLEVVQRIRN
jgi:hypothetical protein